MPGWPHLRPDYLGLRWAKQGRAISEHPVGVCSEEPGMSGGQFRHPVQKVAFF
ncbi:MAG: hypothetical protein GYA41_04285 [Bacteroidales bacterium]|nr:hypothetical protein [Bacteroidales bacterium]